MVAKTIRRFIINILSDQTEGEFPEIGRQLIDHVFLSGDLKTSNVEVINRIQGGKQISDHDGVVVDIGS